MALNPQQVVLLTAEQLEQFAADIVDRTIAALKADDQQTEQPLKQTEYCYGLHGISNLFNVSHATAQRYKDTFLQPAVSQRGRKIMVDVEKAIKLYNDYQRQ